MIKAKDDFSYFLGNKVYMYILLLVAIATYGYEITHAVVGVDDICIGRYFSDGLGISIGRWPFFILNQWGILGVDIYVPFLADLIAVVILILAGTGWCCLFKRIFDRNSVTVNIWCYIVFSIFFISYSKIAYVFVYYLHNGIALAHLCIVAALLLWDGVRYERNYVFIKIVIILGMIILAISFYESFAPVFITSFCIYGGVNAYFEKSDFWGYVKQMGCMCVALYIGIICREKVCTILGRKYNIELSMREANIDDKFGREIGKTIENLKDIFIMNYENYIKNFHNNQCLLLDIAISIILVSAIYLGIKKKNIYYLCNAIIGILSLFIISVYSGDIVYERSTQNMPLFIGFAFFILMCYVMSKKVFYRIITIVVMIILEWNNLCIINFLFYSESKNNERSMAIIEDIGNKILQVGNNEKVIAFIGDFPEKGIVFGNNVGNKYLGMNQGIITWGKNAFGEDGVELLNFFRLNGYDFLKASDEQLKEAEKVAHEMPKYPEEGYVLLQEDYMIVKLGE